MVRVRLTVRLHIKNLGLERLKRSSLNGEKTVSEERPCCRLSQLTQHAIALVRLTSVVGQRFIVMLYLIMLYDRNDSSSLGKILRVDTASPRQSQAPTGALHLATFCTETEVSKRGMFSNLLTTCNPPQHGLCYFYSMFLLLR
jgi:hypothetical protein